MISGQGISPLKKNIAPLISLASPTDVTETRYIKGLASYYRKFIAKLSDIMRPLNDLTKKNTPLSGAFYVKSVLTMLILL